MKGRNLWQHYISYDIFGSLKSAMHGLISVADQIISPVALVITSDFPLYGNEVNRGDFLDMKIWYKVRGTKNIFQVVTASIL